MKNPYTLMQTILVILLSCICLLGCSRTVSPSIDTLRIEFSLTMKDTINLSDNIYIIAFSKASDVSIQPQNPSLGDYFIFPGKAYNDTRLSELDRQVSTYYDNYFDTWESYLYISGSDTHYISSNNDNFNAVTSDNFTYDEQIGFSYNQTHNGSILTLDLDIQDLNLSPSDTLYFSCFTFSKEESTESGYIYDTTSTQRISINQHAEDEELILENSNINSAIDIVNWRVRLY